LYYAVEGEKLIIYVEFLATDLGAFTSTAYTQAHFRTNLAIKAELSGWSVAGQSANGATVTAIPISNSVKDLTSSGTIFSTTGQSTITSTSDRETKDLLSISPEAVFYLAENIVPEAFKYNGLFGTVKDAVAFGYVAQQVEEVYLKAIESFPKDAETLNLFLGRTILKQPIEIDKNTREPYVKGEFRAQEEEETDASYKKAASAFDKAEEARKEIKEFYGLNRDSLDFIRNRAQQLTLKNGSVIAKSAVLKEISNESADNMVAAALAQIGQSAETASILSLLLRMTLQSHLDIRNEQVVQGLNQLAGAGVIKPEEVANIDALA